MITLSFGRNRARDRCLIIYDVTSDRLRNRIAKCLESYGQRVQKSAFEVSLCSEKIRELKVSLEDFANKGADIRIYELHADNRVTIYNSGISFEEPDIIIF